MKVVNEKLQLITDIWNTLILEQEYLKSILKFDKDKKSNYFGEVMHYLNDTFPIISDHKSKTQESGQFHNYILYITGLLQALYVQQDLLDELLILFNLEKSNDNNKYLIRKIRNELIGHPINKSKDKKLRSSVFWLADLSYENIRYRKYKNGKWEQSETINLQVSDLIEKHTDFILKNMNIILNQQEKILTSYKSKLTSLLKLLNKNTTDYTKLCGDLNTYVSSLNNYSLGFSIEYYEKAIKLQSNNIRYEFYINHFTQILNGYLHDLVKNIDEFVSRINGTYVNPYSSKDFTKVIFVDDIPDCDNNDSVLIPYDNPTIEKNVSSTSNSYNYIISKLTEQKHTEYIDLLINEHKNNSTLITELINMKNALKNANNFEYYCSLIYVKNTLKNN
ncbi:MAG: hypothetical protein N4A76_09670 [Firmicutes bacterium]|jgi:hypothetical protein|nr:hypothetical protein [Bacillota bacterium]